MSVKSVFQNLAMAAVTTALSVLAALGIVAFANAGRGHAVTANNFFSQYGSHLPVLAVEVFVISFALFLRLGRRAR